MKKILIVYTSVGLGHKVIAENIGRELMTHQDVAVRFLDLTDFCESWFTGVSARIYIRIITALPWLWRFFYNDPVFNWLALPLRWPLAALKAGKMKRFLDEEKPDLVLTTQTTATAIVSYLKIKGLYKGKLVTTFSDYHFHPFWYYRGVDHYLVTVDEAAKALIRLRHPGEKITVTGLPVSEKFLQDFAEADVYREFGLSRAKPVILVMGGSRGWGIRKDDVVELLGCRFQAQLVIVTGTDDALANSLRKLEIDKRDLLVLSHVPTEGVAKLFSVAKIIVTKPGGLTVAQSLVRGLPMVLVHPLPGMEERNLRYLKNHGVGFSARTPREVRLWVERLLQDQKFYQQARSQAKSLSARDAAAKAAKVIIDTLSLQY